MSFVDLHCHSTASDGTSSPSDVARLAKSSGLSAFALTDHDTIAGVAEAARVASEIGIDFLPGIEISCEYPRPGTMHLLGYGIDPNSPVLLNLTTELIAGRSERNAKLIDKLNSIGVKITMDEVLAVAGAGVVGRPHFAQVIVAKGYAATIRDVFKHYLGQGGQAYLDKERLTARQAIDLIHQSGGLVSLAHPSQLQKENNAQLRTEIKNLADIGLDAVEVIHTDHRESLIDWLSDVAEEYHLLKTGGSDFHGSNKPHIRLGNAGTRRIPRDCYDRLVERLAAKL